MAAIAAVSWLSADHMFRLPRCCHNDHGYIFRNFPAGSNYAEIAPIAILSLAAKMASGICFDVLSRSAVSCSAI